LIEVDDKDDIVTETCQPMSRWHGDDESKDIINECVESLRLNVQHCEQIILSEQK